MRSTHRSSSLVHAVFDRYLLVPLGALLALVWANVAAESYFGFSIRFSFLVNEVGMALFLGLVTQEIVDALQPGGALHTWRRWSLAVIAAAGGILGSALTYVMYVQFEYETVLTQGWPVAVAIDIAASYFLLKLVFPRTSAVYPFLLLAAMVTNGVALTALALMHHAADVVPYAAVLVLLALAIALALRAQRVDAFWPYLLVCAPLSWLGFAWSGLHPALALVPIVPFLPHRPRGVNFLEDVHSEANHVRHIEHEWAFVVQPVVFLFGLVNGGVVTTSYGTGTWAILAGALAGRPAGMMLAVAAALALGWHLPKRTDWRELVVACASMSAGFTLALFAATAVWPIGPLLAEAKLGALLSSAGALVALGLARLLHVGRFAKLPPAPGQLRVAKAHRRPAAMLAAAALDKMA